MTGRPYRGLYVYPWDLADEGVETVAEAARGAGITTLTVAAAYHAGKFLRPHGRSGKVYFPADGTVYVPPRAERYGEIAPIPAPLLGEFDAFDALARRAPDLGRAAWTVCLHNTALGTRYPHYAVRNAFGDVYPYSLSPAFPAVREYVVALCCDIAEGRDLDAVILETPGYLPYDHGFHHEFAMVPLDPWSKWLLALDFSQGAIEAAGDAGIDAERLAAEARGALERYLASDLAVPDAMAMQWLLADLVADPDWTAFLRWRCDLVTDLVRAIREALPPATSLVVIPTVQRPTAACWLEGSDLAGLARAADALEIPAYMPDAAGVARDLWDVRRRAGDTARLRAILRPDHPDLAGGAETAAAAEALADSGVEGLAFYNWGHVRRPALGRMAAAVAAFERASDGGER